VSHRPSLAEPAFPDDDGRADPALAEALGDDVAVLAVIGDVRVFVPVVALLGDEPSAGDKEADMATVLMTGADGRTALLAFSSVATMTAWNAEARPVPVLGGAAAKAALGEGAAAILLDVGGPMFTVIETADVEHLAAGHRLVATEAGRAWVTTPGP
jgi:hypothetical protein